MSDRQFRLTIFHDEDPASLNPNEEDCPMFRLHSFSTRHIDFTDPDTLLPCRYEDEDGVCEWGPTTHEKDREDGELIDHEYVGPEGFFLSYFEHGLCKWGLQGTMSGMPDFRWDGIEYAGFLEVVLPDNEREWWEKRTEEEKRDAAEAFCSEYTDWCNGEVYGYSIEKIGGETCNLGFFHEEPEGRDFCFGLIGFEYFQQEVQLATGWMGATESNTEVVDEAFGMADYGDFFTGHHWIRANGAREPHCQKCGLAPQPGTGEWYSKCPKEEEEQEENQRARQEEKEVSA